MKKLVYILIAGLVLLISCKKPAGSGGNSSIKGSLWVHDYNKALTVIQYQYNGVDMDVYIVYGDDVSYGDKIKTNGNGEFEFKYLRKGDYKVYAISDEQIGSSNDTREVAIEIPVTISKNKQVMEAGQIIVKK